MQARGGLVRVGADESATADARQAEPDQARTQPAASRTEAITLKGGSTFFHACATGAEASRAGRLGSRGRSSALLSPRTEVLLTLETACVFMLSQFSFVLGKSGQRA
jgi:hypothetical protein